MLPFMVNKDVYITQHIHSSLLAVNVHYALVAAAVAIAWLSILTVRQELMD